MRSRSKPVDLLGEALPIPLESVALAEVLLCLRAHPKVMFALRMNSGMAKIGNRFVRFGAKGLPDICGMSQKGLFVGVEVKRSKGGIVSAEQTLFIERIRAAGGIGFVATCSADVLRELANHD